MDARWPIRHLPDAWQGRLCDAAQRRPHAAHARGHPIYIEDEVHVSPDGRWVAFHADESGRWEVYVAAFPTFTSKRQISSGGGVQPQWRADGRELFYLGPDGSMMSVRVDARTEFTAARRRACSPPTSRRTPTLPHYGVTADGQRFLGLERAVGDQNFTFLINWLNRPVAAAQ